MIATNNSLRQIRLHRKGGNNRYELKARFAQLCEEHSVVLTFVARSTLGNWTERRNARRCSLIDKSLHATLSNSEQAELSLLQQEAEDYFDEVAPPPIAGALRVHAELMKLRNSKKE